MASYEGAMQAYPLTDRKRWTRFAIELVAVSGILLALVAYFAKSLSPDAQRAALLEAIRLTLMEPLHKGTKKALSIALPLADAGNRDAQVLAGILFELDGNQAKSTEQLRKADAAGSLYACRRMTILAQPMNLVKLAYCGDAAWQGWIGRTLLQREQPDYDLAIAFLEAGVSNGDPAAYDELGRTYVSGDLHPSGVGVPENVTRAKKLLGYALEHGEAQAGFTLWVQSLNQRSTSRPSSEPQPSDDIAACYKAAELGDPYCQQAVGVAQSLGVGLPKDDVAAYMWFNLATANAEANDDNREKTSKGRDFVAAFLTPTQIAEAQRLTREWKPKKIDTPQEPSLVLAMRQLRDEMDGKFPAVPKILPVTVSAIRADPAPAPAPLPVLSSAEHDVKGNRTNLAAQSLPTLPASDPLDALVDEIFRKAKPRPKLPASGSTEALAEEIYGKRVPKPESTVPLSSPQILTPSPTQNIAAMHPVEKKLALPGMPVEFTSQSLCGTLIKDRAALSAHTGNIRGCTKRQLGGRSDMTVDNTANDTAMLIKLYPSGVSRSAAVRIFTIRPYESWTELGILAGTYELRYEDLATNSFTKTEPLTLSEIQVEGGVKFSHLKVTLYKVKNGNMKTQPIAKAEFDD